MYSLINLGDILLAQYNDVIQWLENKAITEPDKTEHIINTVIDIVAAAFSKPRECVINITKRKNFDGISEEEEKILNFYFRLFRKWME